MERETGLEPVTSSLGSWHSTTELLPLSVKSAIAETVGLPRPEISLYRPSCLSNPARFGWQNGQQNSQHASLRIRLHSARISRPILSVHAVHFTFQSSFQAQNSTTTEWPRHIPAGHTGFSSGSGILRESASAVEECQFPR